MRERSGLRDPSRRAALERLGLHDACTEAFDRLAWLAARSMDAPVALVTLVYEDGHRFVGSAGLPKAYAHAHTSRGARSFCAYVVERGVPLVIRDARGEPEFRDHPAHVEFGTVAYVGIPLRTGDGQVLGAFCVTDEVARDWTAERIAFLTDLAATVVTEIELRRERVERGAAEERATRILETIADGFFALDLEGRFVELNPAAERILERPVAELLGTGFDAVIAPASLPAVLDVFMRVSSGVADNVAFEQWVRRPSGEDRLLALTATAIRDQGRITGVDGIARDITDERQTERALRASDERLRQIAENVSDTFWIFTPDFQETLYVSPAFEEIWGIPLSCVYANGRAFLDTVHPDDVPALLAAMEQVRSDVVMGVEYRVIRADGSVRWVRARGYPVRDEAGEVIRVAGAAEDITERKEAEASRREGERRLQQVLDGVPVGLILAARDGEIVWSNPAGKEIWGPPPAEGLPAPGEYRGWWADTGERIAPRDWPLMCALRGEVVHGKVADVEVFNGAIKSLTLSAVPLRDEAGEITGAVVAHQDVTEVRAREARQRLLAAALEGLREGICLVTREGEIVYANETYTTLLGIDPARIPGIHDRDMAPDEEAAREQEEQLRTAYEQGRWSGRVRRRRLDDGGEIPVDVVLGRVDGSELLFGILQDATAEIAREQHLRRAERLASVGTLIGGVAHELNNPLQAIRSFTELMLLDTRDERDREGLEIMTREAERMSKIVSDLKQIARSTQEEKSQRGPVQLNEVVRHVLKVQEYRLRTSNVEVDADLAAGLPPVLADRSQIEQVVLNLVVNAEQAMASHAGRGRLVIRTRASAAGAALHVVDDGPGIPAERLERIFDPFFTTKVPGEGTGLGLALAHSIVVEHGGEIRVDSQLGDGTSFRVELPRAPEAQLSTAEERAAPAPPASLRVLVVDDEASVRMVMTLYLKRRGHTVEEAADGAAALRMLEDSSFDVILSDIRMPGLGGEAMMECLRARGLASRVVFMTGDAAGAGARLGEAGIPVLLKPIKLQEVAQAVEGLAG